MITGTALVNGQFNSLKPWQLLSRLRLDMQEGCVARHMQRLAVRRFAKQRARVIVSASA
ncbi:hypothetical protein BSIN_2818 [Burkholderia singularis]|uniref:Uncharacterized protein n=1 Tax=Burkholderia singularis TaxID=1503053 RepID=A0A238H3D1_9BURK|nr:hypothetical protein BSIN_2818 [Burkholderia singularis]